MPPFSTPPVMLQTLDCTTHGNVRAAGSFVRVKLSLKSGTIAVTRIVTVAVLLAEGPTEWEWQVGLATHDGNAADDPVLTGFGTGGPG